MPKVVKFILLEFLNFFTTLLLLYMLRSIEC